MRRIWIFALLFSSVAFPCSCVSSGGCAGLGGKAYPVFLGTVLQVTDVPSTGDFKFLSSRRARIRVDESFGGLASDTREVDVLTGSGGGDCGIPFKPGEVYLIAASAGQDGQIYAGICSSTRRIEGEDSELNVLRLARDGKPVPSLVGQIAQYDRNFQGAIGTNAPRVLANTRIRVTAERKTYETWSNVAGLYAFYDLPPGKYRFAPDLPPGTQLSWFIGSDRPPVPFELKAGCEEQNIEVFPSGSIQGHVRDAAGKLVQDALVYIVPAGQEVLPTKRQLYWEMQGKEGFFKFVHLPPGKYLLVVNPDDERNPGFPYPKTFYPGVRDGDSAAVITVGAGVQIKDADIGLQQQFTPRRLTVRVRWSDGRLVNDFVLVQAKGTEHPGASAEIKQPDLKAAVINLTVLPDEPYQIQASLTCAYAHGQVLREPGATLQSNPVFLAPDDERADILLTLPASSCPEIPGKLLLR